MSDKEVKHDLPGDLRAGDYVIYHLEGNWAESQAHRTAIVARVFRLGSRVAVDLTVFLAFKDDTPETQLLTVHDAKYDPNCPAGTFCVEADSTNELPSVNMLRNAQIIDKAESDQHKDAAVSKGDKAKVSEK